VATTAGSAPTASLALGTVSMKEFAVPPGSAPHDVAPAADGGIWYTAQATGELGHLDPRTGQTKHVKLGSGSRPHGVILGPDGAPWITDSGLNAIVRVDPTTSEVKRFPLPSWAASANLNTAAATVVSGGFRLWFTGQSGFLGLLDVPLRGEATMKVIQAPGGRGPYGITVRPDDVTEAYYASLAGSHIGRLSICCVNGGYDIQAETIEPPTRGQGARRVWSDSKGAIWVSEWNAGQVARYDPSTGQWKEWKLPGARPQAYAVFVDDRDIVWLADWGASAIVRFDATTESFTSFPHAQNGNVRQIHGRPGEVFAPLSALDRIFVITTR